MTPPLSRRAWCATVGAGVVSVGVGAALWPQGTTAPGLFGDWRLDVRRVRRVAAPSLGLLGLRVAVIADPHHPQPGTAIAEVTAAVRAFQPHLVAFVGDCIAAPGGEAALAQYAAGLAGLRCCAILGNHEYLAFDRHQTFTRRWLRLQYAKAGMQLLVNQRGPTLLSDRGVRVGLVGLDDALEGTPDYACLAVPAWEAVPVQLVLAHCPVAFEAMVRWQAATGTPSPRPAPRRVMLSGHTHGGQVAGPGALVLPHRGDAGYIHGWYTSATGDALYVSRGLGYSVAPIRVNARPELTLLEL